MKISFIFVDFVDFVGNFFLFEEVVSKVSISDNLYSVARWLIFRREVYLMALFK